MKRPEGPLAVLLLTLALLGPGATIASADTIQVTMSGTITNPGTVSGISSGDAFVSTLTYDSTSPNGTFNYVFTSVIDDVHGNQTFSRDPGASLTVFNNGTGLLGFDTSGVACSLCTGFDLDGPSSLNSIMTSRVVCQ